MTRLARTIGNVVAAGAITALLAGAALAGNPNAPGIGGPAAKPASPPGQEKKGTDAPPNAVPAGKANGKATGEANAKANGKANGKAKQEARRATRPTHPSHPSHPVTPSQQSAPSRQPAFAQSKGKGHAKTAHHKVILCHRTGSATNPYVEINVSINAWQNGHTKHPALDGRSDILLQDPAAPGDKADPALVASMCPGAQHAAATTTAQPLAVPPRAAASGPGAASQAPAVAGGVKGVSAVLTRPAKRSPGVGGVLGAVAAPVRGATLPFTGFPLWAALLLSAGLLAGGLVLRQNSRRIH